MEPATTAALIYGGSQLIAPAMRGIGGLYNWFRRSRDPERYRRQDILQRTGVTPEQYDLRSQNLREALGNLEQPQNVFMPTQEPPPPPPIEGLEARMPTVGAPATPSQVQPNQLLSILNNLNQSTRRGYQDDLARIGARRGPVRNPLGRSSGQLAMMSDAMRGRAKSLAQNRFRLLANYANRNAMAEMEAGNTNLQRDETQNQLMNFLNQARTQQMTGLQSQYLGNQGMNIDEANLRNILGNEQRQQGLRQLRIGMQDPYVSQRPTEGI